MKIISHRGNLYGKKIEYENTPNYIEQAFYAGFDVEVDLWFIDDNFYLGHDIPIHLIESSWLISNSNFLWCHAKNIEAFYKLFCLKLNCFWHEKDKITITSKGIPWCYPGTFVKNGITVCLETAKIDKNIYGICTDYPIEWQKILLEI